MLVLRRRVDEAIVIETGDGRRIRILVSDVQDGRIVRLAIDAPPDIAVHRSEIHRLIQAENRAAAGGDVRQWLRRDAPDDETKENADAGSPSHP